MALTVYDFVRIIAFAIIVLVVALQSTKRFMFVDFILGTFMCLMYLLRPSFFQNQLNVELDGLHFWMLKAITGFCSFYLFFYFFFVRQSKDDDSTHGLLACRTLAQGLATVVVSVNMWRFPKLFSDQVFPLVFVSLMWSCCAAYQLYRSGINLPKRSRISAINRYIKIDVVLALLFGGSDLLFARYTLASLSWKMDNLHIHLTTSCGLLHACAAVVGVYAIGFRNITERKGYLCCRLSAILFVLATFAYAVLVQKLAVTKMDVAVMLTIAIPAIPAVAGLLITADRRSFTSSSTAGYNLRTRSS